MWHLVDNILYTTSNKIAVMTDSNMEQSNYLDAFVTQNIIISQKEEVSRALPSLVLGKTIRKIALFRLC